MTISVQIEEDDLLNLLMKRVENWTDDEDKLELFENFYENKIYGGCFDGMKLNINSIVDNDYINNTSVIDIEEYNEKRNEFLRDEIRNFIEENKDTYEDEEDFKLDLKDRIEELKEEAPEFDDIEIGVYRMSYLNSSSYIYIEAKTDTLLLKSK